MVIDYKEYSKKLTEKIKENISEEIIDEKSIKMGTKLVKWFNNDKQNTEEKE